MLNSLIYSEREPKMDIANNRLLMRLKRPRSYVWFVFIVLMFANSASSSDLNGIKKISKLVSSHQEMRIPYDLITGPIDYKEVDEADAVSGYMPKSTKLLYGSVDTKVYDFFENTSPLYIFESLVKNLKKQNYETLFYCMGLDCGEKDGWRVYLSRHLDGEEGSQHYFVAKKVNSDTTTTYKSAFIIDIDSEPRLSLSSINVPMAIKDVAEIDSMLETKGKVSFPALFFASGSSDIRSQGLLQLQQIADYLSGKNNPGEKFVLVGYADKTGEEKYNQELSERRANTVLEYLVSQYDIDSNFISAKGAGVSDSPNSSLQKNRKVELVKEIQLLGYKE